MSQIVKLGYDLDVMLDTFGIEKMVRCEHLDAWLSATYSLDSVEQTILDDLLRDMQTFGEYWNEEELKIRFIGSIMYVAKVDVAGKIRVFYERPMAATIGNFRLAVICDCLVAQPKGVNTPRDPYFFLQEFKKGKGEKNDPEAQMMMAMLIAQHQNNDGQPVYGGYLVGQNWHFTTLSDKQYCVSRQFDAAEKGDLEQIVFILRKLKELVIKR